MVNSYGRLETRSNGAKKMDIVLSDIRNDRMVVTLWEDKAGDFIQLLSDAKEGPVFIVVTGLLAKKFAGTESLSSTDSTKCYLNIDYAPLNTLREGLSRAGEMDHNLFQAPKQQQFVATDSSNIQELNLSSILEAKIPAGEDVLRYICRARIVGILDGNGWFYSCCPKCARTIRMLDGKYYCTTCAEEHATPSQRFRLVVRVQDKTATTTLTLFNKEAEQLIGIPLKKLLAEEEQEETLAAIPPALKNIIGKECVFQLKVTQYNMKHGCEEFTVTRVSEITIGEPVDNLGTAGASTRQDLTGAANKKTKNYINRLLKDSPHGEK